MNINRISNQNFGKFVCMSTWDTVSLYKNSLQTIQQAIDAVDAPGGEGERLDVFFKVGTPNNQKPTKLYVKVKTIIHDEDLAKLQLARPEVTKQDYSRHSKWFPLDELLTRDVVNFLHKQNGYIHYCLNHPDHELSRPSLGKPKFTD